MKVQIISVDFDTDIPKADGNGSYKGVLISFKDMAKGTLKQKGIHQNVFDKTDKLREKLPNLKKNDIVEFVFQANGKFQNLVDIGEVEKPVEVSAKEATKDWKSVGGNDKSKQISICKQSAVSQVVNLLIATGTVNVIDDELIDFIIEKADRLVKYTHGE